MPVDRSTTTPFLIRIFANHGSFHNLNEFEYDLQPKNELNLYSWKDATLGELTTLLAKELIGDGDGDRQQQHNSKSSYKFSYRLVFGDTQRNRYLTRDIGVVQLLDDNTKPSSDSLKTLESARFVTGDWIDIAVLQPGDRAYDAARDTRLPYGRGQAAAAAAATNHHQQYRPHNDGRYNRPNNNNQRRPYDRRERDDADRHRWTNDNYRPHRR